MPRNGSGTYTLPQSAFVAGTVISSSVVNSDFSDIATALTGSLPRDGQAGMTGQLKVADGSAIAPAMTFSNETNTGFTRPNAGQIGIVINGIQVGIFSSIGITTTGIVGLTPVGAVLNWCAAAAPATWILCFGQAISRVTYAALFAVVGTTFGSGDGSTTFNLPDLRGRAIAGNDAMGGVAAGRLTSSFFGTSASVTGAVGGLESRSLALANIPNFTPGATFSGTTHTWFTDQSNVDFGTGNASGPASVVGVGFQGQASVTVTPAGSVTLNSSINGSQGQTSFASVQPTIILNKIIYAGV